MPLGLLRRHLSLPSEAEWTSELSTLADAARDWYGEHGRPWSARREIGIVAVHGQVIHLEGGPRLTSSVLGAGLEEVSAHALVIVAVSAGPEVEREIDRLWKVGRPDAAMFLSAWAISVVERLRSHEAEQIAELAARQGMTVLPHYSPGYEGWDLSDQRCLYDLIVGAGLETPGPLELLPSGELKPVRSTLAVFGVTASRETAGRATAGSRDARGFWSRRAAASAGTGPAATGAAARGSPSYAVPERTLERWASRRLTVTGTECGRLRARFRFDGTTCSNMGMPLAFDYEVELTREAGTYRVLACACAPAIGDTGHRRMCAYTENPEAFMSAIREAPAWAGRTLDDLLEWTPVTSLSGCLCTRASRDHKWRLVLHTLHYALMNEVVPIVE